MYVSLPWICTLVLTFPTIAIEKSIVKGKEDAEKALVGGADMQKHRVCPFIVVSFYS